MEVRNLFNILLLSLSLTTVLLTIATYIMFRLRQSFSRQSRSEIHHLNSQYFRRFAPHLKIINEDTQRKNQIREERREKVKKKMRYVYAFTLLTVTALIASENYLSFRNELKQKVKAAEEYRNLIQSGLLKKHELNLAVKSPELTEYFSDSFKERIDAIVADLSEKEIVLFSNESNLKKTRAHSIAFERWKAFLARHGVRYEISQNLKKIPDNGLVIVPQIEILTDLQRSEFDSYLNQGGQIIITGAFGTLNGKGQPNNPDWFNRITGLVRKPNLQSQKPIPTRFSLKNSPLWDVPPGLILPWFPTGNNDIRFFSHEQDVAASESNFDGNLITDGAFTSARLLAMERGKARVLWSSLDPPEVNETIDSSLLNYSDSIILSSMSWALGSINLKIADWTRGYDAASVISVSASAEFKKVKDIISIAKSAEVPVSVFVESDAYRVEPKILKFLTDVDEVGSHSVNALNISLFDLRKSFEALEKSKMDIEENWKKTVQGFKPPEEAYSPVTLNALIQNGYRYIFGDNHFSRYAPVSLANGDLMFFPRVMDSDFHIERNKLLYTPEAVSDHMLSQLERTRLSGGLYILNVSTGITSQSIYEKAFEKFLSRIDRKRLWMTTFRDANTWRHARDRIVSTFSIRSNKNGKRVLAIKVTNNSDQSIDNSVLLVDDGRHSISRPTGENRIPANADDKDSVLSIELPTLPAKQSKTFEFDLLQRSGN